MLSDTQKAKIQKAFSSGTLRVRSVAPEGGVEWKQVLKVHRMPTSWERIVRVHTENGSFVATGGHSVYTTPTTVKDAELLQSGDTVLGKEGRVTIERVAELLSRPHMYDLTVKDNHNLILEGSGVCVSNCPDKYYHFRPPTSSGTINEYNRVFAYIWEDEELIEYMEQAVWTIDASPPETHFGSINMMVQGKRSWIPWIMVGATINACIALSLNWIEEEFSVGGEVSVGVRLPDGRKLEVSIEELYEICEGDDGYED